MTSVVKVLSTALKEAYRLIKINRYGGDKDILTPDEAMPCGLDSNPVKDMLAIYAETGVKGQAIIVGYLQKNRLAEPGEFRTYATDANGQQVFYTWMKADGTMEIGGTADFAVKYSKLEVAFNELKSDFNTLVSKFNAHTHPYIPALAPAPAAVPTSVTATPATPTAADITPAKNDKIKTL